MEIDTVLKDLMQAIGTVKVRSKSGVDEVAHTLLVQQIANVNLSGDEANPIVMLEARNKLIYLRISESDYIWSTGKAGHKVSHKAHTFNMSYDVMEATINVEKVSEARPKFDKIFTYATGKSLAEYGAQKHKNIIEV